jgi:glycosyltransferase involved in cell wall biosynthesis
LNKPLVVVTDPYTTGHHQLFLRLLVEAFAANGADVALVGPAIETPTPGGWHQLWEELEVTACDGRLALRRQAISWLRTLARHLDRIEAQGGRNVDLVFFSYLDLLLCRWLVPLDWRRIVGLRRFSGLIIQGETAEGRPHRRWRRGLLAPWALLYSRLCPAVATLNEGGAPSLARFLGHKPVLVFPDVAGEQSGVLPTNFSLLQEIRIRARGRPTLVLLGGLVWRKGLDEFLRLAGLLPVESWFLVCAGQPYNDSLSDEATRILARARTGGQENFLLCERWLADEEFEAILHNATAVFAAYRNWRHSSNLLTRAAQAMKPVLVSDGSLIAHRVCRYKVGLAVPEGDVSAMVDILMVGKLQSLASTDDFSAGCRRYQMEHSVECLHQMVGSLLNICGFTGI